MRGSWTEVRKRSYQTGRYLSPQHQLLGAGVKELHELDRLDDDISGDGGEAEGDL